MVCGWSHACVCVRECVAGHVLEYVCVWLVTCLCVCVWLVTCLCVCVASHVLVWVWLVTDLGVASHVLECVCGWPRACVCVCGWSCV